jgi:hypothetical protein
MALFKISITRLDSPFDNKKIDIYTSASVSEVYCKNCDFSAKNHQIHV